MSDVEAVKRFETVRHLLKKASPDERTIYSKYLEREKIDRRALGIEEEEGETPMYEVRTRELDWRNIGRGIWGSLKVGREESDEVYDRAMLLHLARIIAQIGTLKMKYGIMKNARIVIAGRSGIGKTTYAILSLYGASRLLGLDRADAWRLTIALTFMDIVEFAKFMKFIVDEDIYLPAVIIDEAGLALSKYWILMNRRVRKAFPLILEIFDLIKDWIGTLILTSPTEENIAKRFRDIRDYLIIGDEFSLPRELEWFTVWVLTRKRLRYYEALSIPDRTVLRKAKLEDMPIYIDVIPSTIKLPREYWEMHREARKNMVSTRLESFLELMEMIEEETKTVVEDEEEP